MNFYQIDRERSKITKALDEIMEKTKCSKYSEEISGFSAELFGCGAHITHASEHFPQLQTEMMGYELIRLVRLLAADDEMYLYAKDMGKLVADIADHTYYKSESQLQAHYGEH